MQPIDPPLVGHSASRRAPAIRSEASLIDSPRGFTILELVVALAIVSLLAALAVPTWSMQVARARQTEARTDLASIYTLEMGFHQEKQTFSTLAEIGFVASGTHYTYCVGADSCVAASAPLEYGGGNPGAAGNGGGPAGAGGNSLIGGGSHPCNGCSGQSTMQDSATPGGVPITGGTPPPAVAGNGSGVSSLANGHYGTDSFEADAMGRISAAPAPHDIDTWIIDESRDLVNVAIGY